MWVLLSWFVWRSHKGMIRLLFAVTRVVLGLGLGVGVDVGVFFFS